MKIKPFQDALKCPEGTPDDDKRLVFAFQERKFIAPAFFE